MSVSPSEKWDDRYKATSEYIYGTDPNDFLKRSVDDLPPGNALCLADGEGRNGVYLANLGHNVTSVDVSPAGLAKAQRLATEVGVELTIVEADLADYDLGEEQWDLIVSIFAHTPPSVRARVHGAIACALRPGGRFILEAYTPDQIGRGTGGPPVPELTMTAKLLAEEVMGLSFALCAETLRSVQEGPGHTGEGSVVQLIAVKADS